MSRFLYNVQRTVEIYADTEEEADEIMAGAGHPQHNQRIIDVDCILVEVDPNPIYATCCCHKCKEIKEYANA